jgi:hypothetical protein
MHEPAAVSPSPVMPSSAAAPGRRSRYKQLGAGGCWGDQAELLLRCQRPPAAFHAADPSTAAMVAAAPDPPPTYLEERIGHTRDPTAR